MTVIDLAHKITDRPRPRTRPIGRSAPWPPNRAVVLCVDEKPQIQALDREQPVLPMALGVPERRTHTYVRNGTGHRLTKVKHPWTDGQVERMNRTIKEATVKRYHYDSHAQLTADLHDFINPYNYGYRLKTLRGLTPYEYICKQWANEPKLFNSNPHHQIPGPNS